MSDDMFINSKTGKSYKTFFDFLSDIGELNEPYICELTDNSFSCGIDLVKHLNVCLLCEIKFLKLETDLIAVHLKKFNLGIVKEE